MFPLNMNTQKRYPFSEKPAINNFYQMFHREPSFMSDTRNQCLQLVPYMKRVLCTSKDAEYLLTRIRFSCQEPEQIVQIYFITMLGKESKRRKVKKPWVTSALYSPFIPLQLSEGNALSTDPLQTEAKGTISSALYTEDRTLNSPQYHIVSVQYFSSEKFQSTWQFQQFFKVTRAFTNTSPCPLQLLIHHPLNPV